MTEERKHSVRWEVGMFKTERVGETWGWGLKSRVLGNCQAEAGNLPHIWGQPELCRAVGVAWTSIDFQELGLIVTDTVWGHWRWHSRESGCVCELSVSWVCAAEASWTEKDWRADSAVKTTSCSRQGLGFSSWHSDGSSRPSVTLVPGALMPSSGIHKYQPLPHGVQTNMQALTHTYRVSQS